jgi:hypothetical protein
MNNTEDYRDLMDVLSEVRRRVTDNRLIWCKSADTFETTVSHRQGLLLGGAWSPHFLRDSTGAALDDIPWTRRLMNPRIVVTDKATDALAVWLPLLEAVAKAGESLLMVTSEISTEILHTLIVNSVRATLPGAVIRQGDGRAADALGKVWTSPPTQTDRVPQAAEAWVRRTGSVLFPAPGDSWRGDMQDVEIISVGGESYDHQQDRLRYLVRTIQTPVRQF